MKTATVRGASRFVALAAVVGLMACVPKAPVGAGGEPARKSPVACKELETLRTLRKELSLVTNPRTGHSLQYVVVGEGARSSELILLFNGTGGVLSDWPIQMLTNAAQSPRIVRTGIHDAAQEGALSLCHDYRLVLFDYPGVGEGKATGNVTADQIADDVDAMLEDVGGRYGLPTNEVNLVGWSLGTLLALKYAVLSPAARPDRKIHDLVLIATKPGGSVEGHANGHQSQCVSTLMEALRSPTLSRELQVEMKKDLLELLFPYVNQQPYDGTDSGCTAKAETTTGKVTLNVEPAPCSPGTSCGKNVEDDVLNRVTPPWSHTQGVSQTLYEQQRELVQDWNSCYCASAEPGFKSTGCSCTGTPAMSNTNGGVCQTRAGTQTPQAPSASQCVPLKIQGGLTVIAGREDLFIQWTYGKALVEGYQQAHGKDKASLVLYDGAEGAGHGVLIQHPKWVQEQIYTALQKD
jgi:pimeloyl-ACP methyl ester carboxylesterase